MQSEAVALAMTGASGMPYGLRLLEMLLRADETVYLMISSPARLVLEQETDMKLPNRPVEIKSILDERYGARPRQLHVFGKEEWAAPVASGSSVPRAMVVCPCTAGSLASIATGASRNLIERAADVVLKERRQLIVVPRETPFSVIHLEHMLRLAKLGVVVLPPIPGFYHQPTTVQDLVDFVVARILDHLNIEQELVPRWGSEVAG